MKLKKWFDRLFRKKSINSIVLLGSLVELPTRDEIKDEEIVKELDQYKKEYLSILSHKKVFISKDLEDNFMHEVMRNTDLLLRTMQPNQMEELYFIDTDKEEVEQLRHQVSLCKLNTYYETTKQLEQEMILRSVALTEISNEIFFFSSFKKNALKEELNHLGASIQMLRSQRKGIMLEASSYLSHVETTSNSSLKKQKLNLLHSITRYDSSLEGEDIKTIATLENQLEVYFYDKDKETLKKEKEQLLSEYSNEAELKLWAMAIYGKDLVTEEELATFYEGKFNVWSNKLYEERKSLRFSRIEEHFYSKIIERKIERLLNGNLGAYENVLEPSMVAKIITKTFKWNGKFSGIEILQNKAKVRLLLSFDVPGRFEQVFKMLSYHTYRGKEERLGIDLHEDILKIDSICSLETLFFLAHVENMTPPTYSVKYYPNYLYPIYHTLKKKEEEDSFRFPSDIERIEYPTSSTVDVTASSKKWIQNLRNLVNGKDLVIPRYMTIFYNAFDNMTLKDIYLEGTNEVVGAFNQCQIEKIHFSDFPKIRYSFSETKIKELCFPFFSLGQMSSEEKKKLIHTLFQFYQTSFDYQEQSSQAFPRFERLKIGQGENEIIVTSDKLGYIFDKKIPQYILKEQQDTLLTEGVSTIVEHIIGEEKEKQKVYTKKN